MKQAKENLQKWKVAGAIFLFAVTLITPALAGLIDKYCCEDKIGDRVDNCATYGICHDSLYIDRYCCYWGWSCPVSGDQQNNGLWVYRAYYCDRNLICRDDWGAWYSDLSSWPTPC